MPLPLRQFRAVAGLTVRALFRQPVCLLLMLTACALMIFLPQMVAHQLGQQSPLARDSTLAFQLVFGVLLVGYAASSTLQAEYASGALLTVFSRPVDRAVFFLAKVTAIAVLTAFYLWLSTSAALVGTRLAPRFFEPPGIANAVAALVFPVVLGAAAWMNHRRGYSFPAAALLLLAPSLSLIALWAGSRNTDGTLAGLGTRLDWALLPAGLMTGLLLLPLSGISLALASRLRPAPAVGCLAVVFAAGLVSDYLISLCIHLPVVPLVLRATLPHVQSFWMADILAESGNIPAGVLWHGAAYAVAYSTAVIAVGILGFRRREF